MGKLPDGGRSAFLVRALEQRREKAEVGKQGF
jgi:hypothetical protein